MARSPTSSNVNPNTTIWLIPLLGALVAFAPLSIDMYLPALPSIAQEFQAAAGAAQYSLATYFIGMALGQVFYGTLSDRYGRKPPLYFGLMLYVLASIGCALAPNLSGLLICRFFQALGGCAGIVIPLAMVGDLFDQQNSAKILSRLMLVMGMAPMLAPLLGAQLLDVFGWRAIFWVLAGCGCLALLALHIGLAETLTIEATARQQISFAVALKTYRSLLRDRQYLGYALASAFAFAGMFAYIAGSPTVLIQIYGMSPQNFGWIFGSNAFGLILASQINHYLLKRWPADQLLALALHVMLVLGLLLLGVTYFMSHSANQIALPLLLLPLFVFIACIGFISPNACAGAMDEQNQQAGSASALLGSLEFAIATVAGAAVGFFSANTALAMGAVMALCATAAWLSYQMLVKPKKTTTL